MGQRLSLAQPNPITTNSCHWYRPMPMAWIARLSTSALARYDVSGASSGCVIVVVGKDSVDDGSGSGSDGLRFSDMLNARSWLLLTRQRNVAVGVTPCIPCC